MKLSGAAAIWILMAVLAASTTSTAHVKTDAGLVEGTTVADGRVRMFLGIPYAAPPVGGLRWKAPQPVPHWAGVRRATGFGPRCMQGRIFDDMIFRDEMSEDCLFLNVWTPAPPSGGHLPVMVWIYGGGFQGGSASEPRQDGEALARRGVVVVSMNYRLGVFGYFAHPELTRASDTRASGNQGLLDQVAALKWVQRNIAAFGGDPHNVLIFGESAGSFAVSAHMASPLSRSLFHKAIGESGAYLGGPVGTLAPKSLAASEDVGKRFAATLGASSLDALLAMPADEVLKASLSRPPSEWFSPTIDGYVLTEDPYVTFTAGRQARVPLLAGWNEDEGRAGVVLAKDKVTAASFIRQAKERYKDAAEAYLKEYPATSDDEAVESAAAFAGDMFIGYGTWKWIDLHAQTGQSVVYRYLWERDRPISADTTSNGVAATSRDIGARHAGEIEYVFGTLKSDIKAPWEPIDFTISDQMMAFWSNFAKRGNPSGAGVAPWPAYSAATGHQVMHIGPTSHAAPDALRPRYLFLDRVAEATRKH
jgi:para-nitrobenzyl esterase